ncbi:MalY/PatB family protein [Sutterella sp.]|uniref:MalY/PatB family protein n=1 Tax=Sutterella sp. TaxID=1981025 RepID=UPI0026E0086C|nr:MalY/PatB family protein [Sutterella sp.]MDO5531479.1 MalY/PatB family protein [Sutterella sp.]
MNYDFDRVIDRSGTDTAKWSAYPKDVLPLWVADSDFETPAPVVEAVRRIAEVGVYGYPNAHAGIVERATVDWCARQYGFELTPNEVQYCPSMSFGLAVAIRAFTKPGGKVLMQVPIYPPFTQLTKANGRIASMNPLKLVNGRYEIDFADFEKRASDPECSLFLLCSPHNPTGRVFSREELERMVSICCRHNVVILSDEVHSGFVFSGTHTTLPTLSEAAESITVLGTSPSKTFNTAGLRAAVMMSKNPALNARVRAELEASQPDRCCFAQVALATAWTECDDYGEQVRKYVRANLEYAVDFIRTRIPAISAYMPEATYLMWLDCSKLGFKTQAELTRFFLEEAKVAFNPGESFGPGGKGHMRMNLACPRSIVTEALERVERAVNALQGR